MIRVVALAALLLATPSAAQTPSRWARSWAAAPQDASGARPGQSPASLADTTIRQVVRLSTGGTRLRLRLSNEMADAPLQLNMVRIGLSDGKGGFTPGSERTVTFDGDAEALLPAHSPLVSDAIALTVVPLAKLLVSFHVPEAVATPTVHTLGRATTTLVRGGETSTTQQRYFLTGVDVEGRSPGNVIVTIGDSITDGARASVDADRRWPDILAERLQAAGMRDVAVANLGISGNRVLKDGAGPNLLSRIDRDVLSIPGVRHVIILEGINDIGSAARDSDATAPTADDITDGYAQLIARAHDRGIKVHGATILPYKGAGYYSEAGDATRRAVNAWIRKPGNFDGVIDFDAAVRDPADPLQIAPANDGGDKLHPGDVGYKTMADAIDLKLFR